MAHRRFQLSAAPRVTRRTCLGASVAATLLGWARLGRGFGEEGAFNPRMLVTGTSQLDARRASAPAQWSIEVMRRTSAPARVSPTTVRADSAELLAEPFAVWAGPGAPEPLTRGEVAGLQSFLGLGGVLLLDELEPEQAAFTKGALGQLGRVLPQGSAIAIGDENVIFRSFYLLPRASGRAQKHDKLRAIVRGGAVQVIVSPNDLLGALAREAGGVYPFEVVPGGESQREQAVRLAVNIAMYVLCSSYKDDEVHAPFLMRRRVSDGR